MSTKHVYFIEGAGCTKIGLSRDVEQRLASLQAGSPVELRLIGSFPGTWRTEQLLHATYAEHRLHGEWFACSFTPESIEEIEQWVKERHEAIRAYVRESLRPNPNPLGVPLPESGI